MTIGNNGRGPQIGSRNELKRNRKLRLSVGGFMMETNTKMVNKAET